MTTANFPGQVNVVPAIGVEGDFASANPRQNLLAGAGAMVAGPLGVAVGRFVWMDMTQVDDLGVGAILNNYGTGPVAGFLHRGQQAMITGYLDGASLIIPPGFQVGDTMTEGDYLCRNTGSGQAQPGMKAYANFQTGLATFAATGSPTTGASATGSTVAAATFAVTGGIVGNVLTVTAVGSGSVRPGATISGTDVSSGTKIVSQLTGTAHGVGTYAVSLSEQDVAAGTAIAGTYGTFTAGTTTGAFHVGDILTGTGVTAGTTITEFITGTGGAGTYAVDKNDVVGSATISVLAVNVETKWYARSFGLTNELVVISSTPLG